MKNICILLILTMLALSGCASLLIGAAGTAIIAGNMQEQSIGSAIDDVVIDTKIALALQDTKFANLQIKVVEGKVLLVGTVANPEVIAETVKIVCSVNGVMEVINEIVISPEKKPAIASALITAKAKLKIFAKYPIKFINYKVLTVDNIVYLIGIAETKQELADITQLVSAVKGVSEVVNHVRLKNNTSEGL